MHAPGQLLERIFQEYYKSNAQVDHVGATGRYARAPAAVARFFDYEVDLDGFETTEFVPAML